VIVGGIDTPGSAVGVAVQGDFVFVADGYSGLQIVPRQCGDGVPVFLSLFDLQPGGATVTARWQVTHRSDPADFRLVGSNHVSEWEISYSESGSGIYVAEDRSAHLAQGGRITYRLFLNDSDGSLRLLAEDTVTLAPPPQQTRLLAARPNPFNPRTTICFECRQAGHVRLVIHDLSGRRVTTLVDGWLPAGRHQRDWDGRDAAGRVVAAGQYLVRLETQEMTDVQKVILAK